MSTIIHKNLIPKDKRIILHDNKALNLISFHTTDPTTINDWVQRGKRPILWDPESWKLVQHTKWKLHTDKDSSVISVEACVL